MAGVSKLGGRNDILKVIEGSLSNVDCFLGLHKNKRFSIAEFLQSLPTKDITSLWIHLSELCNKYSMKIVVEEDESISVEGSCKEVIETLSRITQWVTLYLSKVKESVFTEALWKIVKSLNDILLVLTDVSAVLQNKVSMLCESWWARKLKNSDELVPNTLLYLVVRSLGENAKAADVKRVWSMRSAMLLLDFVDDSSVAFKEMLLLCTRSSIYLKTDEGSKLISFMFGLHPQFVLQVHKVITSHLPGSPAWAQEAYGQVYYRAWRLSEEPYHSLIENDCVQDLMHTAVHSSRTRPNEVFQAYRRVLSHFHQQTNLKQVQEMLHRLYKPILWRYLRVANDLVRANAVTLMLDAFPLLDPSTTKRVVESEVQRQVDIMKELLFDDAVVVRVTVIIGVCHVLSCYWEMLPVHVLRELLTKLISDLAFDSSSVNVRVAVMQGLCVLLQQRLSHPVLKELLPMLGNHIHDTAERVRLALLDLLIVVKGMRSIKFWSICSMDHLLARMEIDSPHVTKRIVTLLMDAFSPSDQKSNIKRCLILLESNPVAAWKFYQFSVAHMSVTEAVRFVVSILHYVKYTIKVGSEALPSKAMTSEENIEKSQEMTAEREESVSVGDITHVARLLEVAIVLLEGYREKLKNKLQHKVVVELVELLPCIMNYFEDSEHIHLVYWLGTYLPSSQAIKGSIDCLLSQQPGQHHEPLLMAIVHGWGQQCVVMDHIKRGLEVKLHLPGEKENKGRGMSKNNKKEKRIAILWPVKSLEVLDSLLFHPLLCEKLNDRRVFEELCDILKKSMSLVEHIFADEKAASTFDVSLTFISNCFSFYNRILLHLKSKFDVCIDKPLQEAILWCETVVLPHLGPNEGGINQRRNKNRKRKSSGQPNCNDGIILASELTVAILESMFKYLCDVLITGLFPPVLDAFIVHFACETAKKAFLHFYPQLSNILYQLVDFCSSSDEDLGNMSLQTKLQVPSELMEVVLKECAIIAEEDAVMFHKVWSTFKPSLVNSVVESTRHSCLSFHSSIFPIYSAITRSIISAYNMHVVKNPSMTLPSKIQDLPLFVSCMLSLICKNQDTFRIFLFHLDHELDFDRNIDSIILTHLSVLHLLNSLKEKNMLINCCIGIAGKSCGFRQSNAEMECFQEKYSDQLNLLHTVYEEVHKNLGNKNC